MRDVKKVEKVFGKNVVIVIVDIIKLEIFIFEIFKDVSKIICCIGM